MDSGRKAPEDGTLAWVPSKPDIVKTNIMIIKVPEHLRSPSDPIFHLATVDRSIPGDDFSGNNILDKLYPDLPKVTLFEEPKPKDDTPSPKKFVRRQEFVRSRRASSNTGSKSRSYYYKKPLPETSNRPNADEISPWIPGNEPYIPHGLRRITTVPLIAKSGPRIREYCEMNSRPVNDSFVPHRENHPLPQEYPHNPGSFGDCPPPNYPGGFDDGLPSDYPGIFDDGPPTNYPGGFDDGPPQPTKYSKGGLLPLPKYTNPIRRSFRNPNSRGGHTINNAYQEKDTGINYRNINPRDDGNLNQRFQSKANFRKNSYPNRGHPHAQRRTFQNGERSSETQRWIPNERLGPSTNKDRGKIYGTDKPRTNYRHPRKPFGRGRQNYR